MLGYGEVWCALYAKVVPRSSPSTAADGKLSDGPGLPFRGRFTGKPDPITRSRAEAGIASIFVTIAQESDGKKAARVPADGSCATKVNRHS